MMMRISKLYCRALIVALIMLPLHVWGDSLNANMGKMVSGAAADRDGCVADDATPAPTEYFDEATGLHYTKVSLDDAILFDSRSCDLNGRACKELLRIAVELREVPFAGIVIYGSADDTESRDYAVELSRERAEVVRDYFVALGFSEELLSVVGLGCDYPVADNSTLEGRARNRCVEVYIVRS